MPRRSTAELAVIRPNSPAPRLTPPADLPAPERALFAAIVGSTSPSHFAVSDRPLLVRYCEAAVLADKAAERLRVDGAVVKGRTSAWLVVQEKAVRAMIALSMRLRISPQARAPRNVKSRAPSYYEALYHAGNHE